MGNDSRMTLPTAADSDAALVTRCQGDDRRAFNEIVARYKDRVYNYIRGMVGSPEDAEDLAQETFVRAYSALGSFESRATLHTWLFRIATNLCIDYKRRARRIVGRQLPLDAIASEASPSSALIADSTTDPAVVLGEKELHELIQAAVSKLPERLRTVFLLHDVEGLRYDEVAAVVRCPLGTVKSRLFHARMALRETLLPYLRGDTVITAFRNAAEDQVP